MNFSARLPPKLTFGSTTQTFVLTSSFVLNHQKMMVVCLAFSRCKFSLIFPKGVQLEVLAKFQRMKTLTQEVPVMASAVSRCKMVQLSEDRLKVRRKTPLPEQDTSEERTVFVVCSQSFFSTNFLKPIFLCLFWTRKDSLPLKVLPLKVFLMLFLVLVL